MSYPALEPRSLHVFFVDVYGSEIPGNAGKHIGVHFGDCLLELGCFT
jgi:hypothetical protein